ncbi:MAG TPA: NAD+ synthase [Thermoleophilaceae bacterium]|nr:NAD+ synthase [Thermoleophilaceae bacterium]
MADDLRIALGQMNAVVGDIDGNARRVADLVAQAGAAGVDLVVFPELTLTGYPPEDLLLKRRFLGAARAALNAMAFGGVTAVVGFPEEADGVVYNAAAVVGPDGVQAVYRKQLLPNYGVFDERRWFEPGRETLVVDVAGTPVGVTVCEDIWAPEPAAQAASAGARVVVNLSASPYHCRKGMERERMVADLARTNGVTMAFCNLVGGQDELVFDGHSLLVGPGGEVLARGVQFDEALVLPGDVAEPLAPEAEVYGALVTGVRDYVQKNGFDKVVIASSGGIDSALTVLVAADALGADRVVTVTMPSRYSSEGTRSDARRISENLGLEFHELPIEDPMGAYEALLGDTFAGREPDLTEENLQARVRGNIVMALSNKFGWLVLTTGNKSEMSVGYATLYGDMAGGFAVLKDVFKGWVYRLVRWRNEREGRELVPASVLERPPSAELRDDQRDDQSLPPYDVLDAILEGYVEGDLDAADLIAQGLPEDDVRRVIRMVDLAEYKRRQAPPGVKISTKAFGRDRRLPITNRWRG